MFYLLHKKGILGNPPFCILDAYTPNISLPLCERSSTKCPSPVTNNFLQTRHRTPGHFQYRFQV